MENRQDSDLSKGERIDPTSMKRLNNKSREEEPWKVERLLGSSRPEAD